MKRLRILVVHNKYKISGGEDTVVDNEIQLLTEAGHTVIHYERSNAELDNMGIMKKVSALNSAKFSRNTYNEVKKIIEEEKIDIVHVHNTLTLITPSVYYAAIDCNVPVVQTVHNFRLICPGALLLRNGHICEECISHGPNRACRYKCYRASFLQSYIAARILLYNRKRGVYKKINYICLTSFNREKLLSAQGIFDKSRIYIKPNFAQMMKYIPYRERKKQFVCVSRLSEEKGIPELLDAWKEFERKGYDINLILCGDGELKNDVEKKIEAECHHVTFMGKTDHKKVLEIISESLLFVFPTKWYEGFPMVIAECFSCGTPVLTNDIGNPGKIVINGENGITTQISKMSEVMASWGQNPYCDEHVAMSQNCLQSYNDFYSPEQNIKILENIYSTILDSQDL